MKCAWSHCRHNNIISENEQYVKKSSKYYHFACDCERENINKSIILFTENVNDQVVMSQLRGIINNLIFKQGFEAEYVVFAIKYAIEHPELKLMYPQGLHRICKDQNILNLWKKKQADDMLRGQSINLQEIEEHKIEYNFTKKKRSVSDLFG